MEHRIILNQSMKTKKQIIRDYIRQRNRKAGLALKAKMPKDYYKKIGALSHKNKGGLDTSVAGMIQ